MRRGFTFLEVQVAVVVLGIALAGLYPLVVMQSRHLEKVEARLDRQATHYLVPSMEEWGRKLGAAAQLTTTDPGPKPAAPLLVLDNGDTAYTEMGTGWEAETQADAYRGGQRWHAEGTGTSTASWSFSGLEPGWYDVQVTWHEDALQASNAPFTVQDGATSRGTFAVNQQAAPGGVVFDGRPWHSLGVVVIATGNCTVVLGDQADARVVADGVRLVAVRNVVAVSSLEKTLTGEEVTVRVAVTVQTPQ